MRSSASAQPKVTPTKNRRSPHNLVDMRPRSLLRDQVELVGLHVLESRAGAAAARGVFPGRRNFSRSSVISAAWQNQVFKSGLEERGIRCGPRPRHKDSRLPPERFVRC